MANKVLRPGTPVPRFSLKNQDGELVTIEQFLGKPFILFFYPKDDTPGCTAEACGFRDVYDELSSLGAVVIGISADSPASHRAFIKKYHLPFTLLSDEKNEVRKLFGVSTGLVGNFLPGRVTFVVDKAGIIKHVFDSRLQAKMHVKEALAALP